MLAIALAFTTNRFHATQWGRHVNEGLPEWPPSPWRILRALVSVWMRTAPEVPVATVVPILKQLAAQQPCFFLPEAAQAHSRHFMPGGSGKRTMVIDSFVATRPSQAVYVIWPGVELTSDDKSILSGLLANLAYLGRAESWCDAQLVNDPPEANCFPLRAEAMPAGDWEITRVLVPEPTLRLKELCVTTGDLRRDGRIDPPGSRWCQYIRPAACLSITSSQLGGRERGRHPTVARFALAGNVLPLITDTLRIAELARQSAMAQYGRANGGGASPSLSGKAPDGSPLEGHQHAFYLPTDEDADGRLDHITVWAPGGLGQPELEALARVRALNPGGGRPEIRQAFLSSGNPEDFQERVPIFCKANVWRTATPFVLNRHVKLRGSGGDKHLIDGPIDQVYRELQRRLVVGAPVASIEFAPAPRIRGWRTIQPLEFYRWRRKGPPATGAFNFSLRFAEPVRGPLAFGYGCHFGLGLFVPADARNGSGPSTAPEDPCP